jgi:hypothetical protein
MKTFIVFITEAKTVWWHGSPSGDLRGGTSGLHLGTRAAAEDALHSRIGQPASGSWDGTRKYGETMIAGQKTIREKQLNHSGYNCDAPEHDHYPHEHRKPPTHSNGEPISFDHKPSIKPYHIIGKMSNTPTNPHDDFKANGYMKAALKKGSAKSGYYYKNVAEDVGSISAVVPNGQHIKDAS